MDKIDFLFSNIANISGIGPKIAPKIEKLVGGNLVVDLLFFKPSNIHKRRLALNHLSAFDKELIITKLTVSHHEKPAKSSAPYKVIGHNQFGFITLVFFKTFPGYIEKNFAIGAKIAVSGKIEFSGSTKNSAQIVHPDFVVAQDLIDQIPVTQVIYPLTFGISLKFLRKSIFNFLSQINSSGPDLPEWIDHNLVKQNNWPSFKKALTNIHYPKELSDLEPTNINIKRLAYDELLAAQMANLISKKVNGQNQGRSNKSEGKIVAEVIKNLPFTLTLGQEKALAEIFADMKSDKKMLRLLQGDVGSGKTIIAFLAAILAAEDGKQSAIIAPISLLAQQHFENFCKLTEKLNINLALLTSKTTKAAKKKLLQQLKDGEIDIIIGTHALIFDDIIFKDLGLIVIDEQHRFGVVQRLKMVQKGQGKDRSPDVLLMSATPIPRSLMMTLYGDMDVSILEEKPKNRIAIDTRVKSAAKIDEIYLSLERAIKNGEKIYWICPLIEQSSEESIDESDQSQDSDLSNVLERFELFQNKFGSEKVALIHGRLKPGEKDKVMTDFANPNSTTRLLIATTVIEVGIDVKDATIIIIENSEKFGLSQLHQLRGRVGRSDKKSYCLLLYSGNLSANGKKRLEIMRESFDGFRIAQEDLEIRGAGQLFGTRQSGLPEYHFANLIAHQDLLKIARKNAEVILDKNPNLDNDGGQNIKNLLRIFKYDYFIKLLQGG